MIIPEGELTEIIWKNLDFEAFINRGMTFTKIVKNEKLQI